MFPTVEHVIVWFTGLVGLKMFKNVEIFNVSDGLELVKYQLGTCQTFDESYLWPINDSFTMIQVFLSLPAVMKSVI